MNEKIKKEDKQMNIYIVQIALFLVAMTAYSHAGEQQTGSLIQLSGGLLILGGTAAQWIWRKMLTKRLEKQKPNKGQKA